MYDFNEIQATDKDQKIRAFAVEKAVDLLGSGAGYSGSDLVNVAEMVNAYIQSGDKTNTITSAVEEGYREGGRFEVKELVEGLDVFDNMGNMTHLDLNRFFEDRGWKLPSRPENLEGVNEAVKLTPEQMPLHSHDGPVEDVDSDWRTRPRRNRFADLVDPNPSRTVDFNEGHEPPPTRSTTVNVGVNEQAIDAIKDLTAALKRVDALGNSERTMWMVYEVLSKVELEGGPGTRLDAVEITNIVGALQNAGILFRERV